MIRRQRVADSEQRRADGLVRQIGEIREHPGHPMADCLPLYQQAAQDAKGNAAKHTKQPR